MKETKPKYPRFRALHYAESGFIMPNAWDAGSARLLSSLGFEAIATTSAGYGFAHGKQDAIAGLSRSEILDNAAEIVSATDLPVSADLEDGFGAEPRDCAETITMAADIGLAGGSIEDATGDPEAPIFDFDHAVDRVRAAAEVARDLPFVLTARAENFINGKPDLSDTIARLQAFSEAGAEVLYAPGLPDLNAIRTVCSEVDRPVNVVMGLTGPVYSATELYGAGVRRISVGGSFARAAFGGLMRAAQEVREHGTFEYAKTAMPGADLMALMSDQRSDDRD